jgi:S1-C subfamily serine protease
MANALNWFTKRAQQGWRFAGFTLVLIGAFATAATGAFAQSDNAAGMQDVLKSVVGIDTRIPANARTAPILGTTRQGSGVVISEDGLILTIGYLVLEALEIDVELYDGRKIPASFVAYDHESGFGLIRAASDIGVTPAQFGTSHDKGVSTRALLANRHGPEAAQGVFVVDRREFTGAWEYLLDSAIFTSPPNPNFSGAGLFDTDGHLIGIGSLFVGNAAVLRQPVPGNMFVPIDELKPILDALVTNGRRVEPARPWLGISTSELRDRLFVDRVSSDGPGAAAGILPGEIIVSVDDAPVVSMSGYFRAIWRGRAAGDAVSLTLLSLEGKLRNVAINSMDRRDWLGLDPSL